MARLFSGALAGSWGHWLELGGIVFGPPLASAASGLRFWTWGPVWLPGNCSSGFRTFVFAPPLGSGASFLDLLCFRSFILGHPLSSPGGSFLNLCQASAPPRTQLGSGPLTRHATVDQAGDPATPMGQLLNTPTHDRAGDLQRVRLNVIATRPWARSASKL